VYPREAKFADDEYAQRVYPSVVQRLINFGVRSLIPYGYSSNNFLYQTTTCCYYGTVHFEAAKTLADVVHRSGKCSYVSRMWLTLTRIIQASVHSLAYVKKFHFGPSTTNDTSTIYDQKCNMDREVPEDNKESTQDSIDNTKKLINYIRSLTQTTDSALVQPILTPRFAISCTPELLRSLGDIAASDPSLHIQAHISENIDEVTTVGELFPGNTSYADVYDSFGLLGPKTILGHAIHLGDDEVELIAKRKAGISHCPTSNFNLTSGIAQVGKYLDAGIKVGNLVQVIPMYRIHPPSCRLA